MCRQVRQLIVIVFVVVGVLGYATPMSFAQPGTFIVSPDGPYLTITDALAAAAPGATVEVHGGVYPAPLYVEKSVSLIGIENPVIDGGGDGSIVIINAADVVFQGFIIRNTGTQMHHEDSAIIIEADNVTVANNQIENVLFGIYFANADNGVAQDNTIIGREDLEISLRGDGIRVWFSNNVRLENNEVVSARDTLIWYADGIQIIGNTFHENRYGLHFMYSSNATIVDNTFANNHVGTYLMYSQDLVMHGNLLAYNNGPSGYGLALKDMDQVVVERNAFVGNRTGLYIDNSPSVYEGENEFFDNFFAYNIIGVTMLPAVERNNFQRNTFLENVQQASTRGRGDLLGNSWSKGDSGNYWSDYVGYDADQDGVGDMPYRAEKLFESLSDNYPELQFFVYSPASQALDFASSAFPSLRPNPKVIDDAPMMHYVVPANLSQTSYAVSASFLVFSLLLLGLGFSVCVYALRPYLPHKAYKQNVLKPERAGLSR